MAVGIYSDVEDFIIDIEFISKVQDGIILKGFIISSGIFDNMKMPI